MQRLLVLAALCGIIAGCANERPSESDKADATSTAAVLFEVDGIRVYRFGDRGRYHYFAVPRSGAPAQSVTTWSESCGKNCTRTVTDEISTLARR